MEEKDFFGFLQTMLNIAADFAITKIKAKSFFEVLRKVGFNVVRA